MRASPTWRRLAAAGPCSTTRRWWRCSSIHRCRTALHRPPHRLVPANPRLTPRASILCAHVVAGEVQRHLGRAALDGDALALDGGAVFGVGARQEHRERGPAGARLGAGDHAHQAAVLVNDAGADPEAEPAASFSL